MKLTRKKVLLKKVAAVGLVKRLAQRVAPEKLKKGLTKMINPLKNLVTFGKA